MKIKVGLLALGMMFVIATMIAATIPEKANQRPPEGEALPVAVIRLEPTQTIERDREFSGIIKAARRSRLAFDRSARLLKVNVDEGDRVGQNQPLAILDSRALEREIARSKALIAQQTAVLNELIKGPRKEQIAATEAEWRASEADAKLRRLSLERIEKLHQRNAASGQQLDEAQLALDAAIANTKALQQRYEELEQGTRQEKIDAQKAMVESLKAELERLQISLTDSTLTAPFAGMITERIADEGDMLQPGQAILELMESEQLEAHIGVPPRFVDHLTEAMQLPLQVDRKTVYGTIRNTLSKVNSVTRTQTVIFDLTESTGYGLADGQLARISLPEPVNVNGFSIPTTALSSGDRSLWRVFIAAPSKDHDNAYLVEARTVESVYTDGNRTIVRGTIYEGELLITEGVHRIAPGQLVVLDNEGGTESRPLTTQGDEQKHGPETKDD